MGVPVDVAEVHRSAPADLRDTHELDAGTRWHRFTLRIATSTCASPEILAGFHESESSLRTEPRRTVLDVGGLRCPLATVSGIRRVSVQAFISAD